MRRALLLSALCALPLPLWAKDVHAPAPVVAATLYPDGATQTHQITLDLPAGAHRILTPMIPSDTPLGLPDISLSAGNATLGVWAYLPETDTDPATLFTPAQTKAKAQITQAENAIHAHEATLANLNDEMASLQSQLDFLATIKAPEGATSIDTLTATLQLIGAQSSDIRARLSDKSRTLAAGTEQLEELQTQLERAKRAFARLSPPREQPDLLAIPVHLSAPQSITIAIHTITDDGGWFPTYDLHLAEPAQDSVTVDRKAYIVSPPDAVWDQIDLTLSTLRPTERVSPSEPVENHARIYEQIPVAKFSSPSFNDDGVGTLDTPLIEPELVIGKEAARMEVDTGGVVVTYRYPGKISATQGAEQTLELGRLALPATPEIYAVPRRDDTAFLVAQLTNDTQEPLLGGEAKVYRGDTLIGHSGLPFLPAGEDTTLPFGPIEGIRLDHVVADNETGDRGLISTTNTREQDTLFRVTNLTGKTQEVKAFYPLTYSEQADLEVEVTARPRPDETDHDNRRGLSVWSLSLAPGATAEVAINTRLNWPEGWELNWYP